MGRPKIKYEPAPRWCMKSAPRKPKPGSVECIAIMRAVGGDTEWVVATRAEVEAMLDPDNIMGCLWRERAALMGLLYLSNN